MTTGIVIGLLATPASGADPSASLPTAAAPENYLIGSAAFVVYGEKCKSARKAVSHYRDITYDRQRLRGAHLADRTPIVRGKTCRWARHAADVWVARAKSALKALERWEHDYAWWLWLPEKFQRVGHCETGGTSGASAAGNWHWDSGTYVSAFGIIRAAFPTWNGHNTPREQYEVAASIQARYGWSAWGCGGA